MGWATFLLMIISGYVAFKLVGLAREKGRLKFLGLTIACIVFFIMQAIAVSELIIADSGFSSTASVVFEWGHIICLAFILSSLAVFIRESKPVFAQFPSIYAGLPLLIIISYLLVEDTYALKNWLLAIYQGGAITVALLMYSVYAYKRKEYTLILTGIILFLFSYLGYWYIPGVQDYSWIWKFMLGLSMIITVLGYEKAESEVLVSSTH